MGDSNESHTTHNYGSLDAKIRGDRGTVVPSKDIPRIIPQDSSTVPLSSLDCFVVPPRNDNDGYISYCHCEERSDAAICPSH